jgi:hypothetical protein
MLPILPAPDLNYSLIHLNAEEQVNPVSVLAILCNHYSPGEMRRQFDNMQNTALLDDFCNDPGERDNQFFFGGLVLKALEACYLICRDPTRPTPVDQPRKPSRMR